MEKSKKLASAQDIKKAFAENIRDKYHRGLSHRKPAPSGWQFPDEVKQIFTELTWKMGHRGKSRFGIEVGKPGSDAHRNYQIEVDYKQAVPSTVVTVTEVNWSAGLPFDFLIVPQFRHENEWPEGPGAYRIRYDKRDADRNCDELDYETAKKYEQAARGLGPQMLELLTSSFSVTTSRLKPANPECEHDGCLGSGKITEVSAVTGEEFVEFCPRCYPGGEVWNLVEMPQPVKLVITSSRGVKEYDITPETLRFDRPHPNPGSVMGYITSVVYATHKACLEEWVTKQQTKG